MDADLEAAKEQFELAYNRVLLIVKSVQAKGVMFSPVIDADMNLVRTEVYEKEM